MATRKNRKTKKIKRKNLRKSGSKSKNSAVKKIQSVYRKKQTRKSKAVTKIQSRYRKKQTKKNRSKAAIKLQKMIRGTISRKECSICQMPGARFKTNCNHFFHKKCLKKWCKEKGTKCTCPICRKNLDEDELNNLSISFASSELDDEEYQQQQDLIYLFNLNLNQMQEMLVRIQRHANAVVSILEDNFLVDTSEIYNDARENARGLEELADEALNYSDNLPEEFQDSLENLKIRLESIQHPLNITDSNENDIINLYRNIATRVQELLEESYYFYPE